MRINNTLYYILKDHLGSASVVTDASGVEVGEQRYYPFGKTRLTTGTIYTDKLFTGQREMAGLGIYHYQARFYSPKLGRFLSADTIVPGYTNPQNPNRYSYVLNNPIRYIDPTGHVCSDPDDPDQWCESGNPYPNNTNPLPEGPIVINNPDPLDDGQEQDDSDPSPLEEVGPSWWANWWDSFMSNQYTPFAWASVQAFAGWGQSIGEALFLTGILIRNPEMTLRGAAVFLASFTLARVAGVVSTGATLYQYNRGLHGTNGTDVWVSVVTSVLAYHPRLSNSMSDINVIYSAYRLSNPAPVNIPFLTPPRYIGGN